MMSIPPRALELIEQLSLIPHPEGGFYKETYRSETTIGTSNRSVMTSIYFLLTHNNCSRFHRIQSDEAWYFHEGDPLQVHTLVDGIHRVFPLGMNFSNHEVPYLMVPANTIFGSNTSGKHGYSLVSCAVAPGFDFTEFELFTSQELIDLYPNQIEIIRQLT